MNSISFPVRSSYSDYGKFASGKKIQQASDGAAELAIIQKQEEQIRGYDAGKKNIIAMKSLMNITDAAQSGMTDYLQRMNELAVRADNSLMSKSDRQSIQQEIDMLKEGMSQLSSTANYNGKNLLDGSNPQLNVSTGSDTMSFITTSNSTLENLGLGDFSVTGKFNSKQITDALTEISRQRAKTGAQTNGLDHTYNVQANASLNTTASKSRIGDLDYPKAISEQRKKEVLQQYSAFMQKTNMRMQANKMIFFE